ncbi:NAD(+) diphosphatase [Sphingomonas antarctica]|uniref:NAD(+) diphosphatase n=1 Tax=Sphingomonas antarctica TaxID=2040274 RepID=UPI0039EC67D9
MPPALTGYPLDRADHLRQDADGYAALFDWRARVLLLDGVEPQLGDDGSLNWGSLAEVDAEADLIFLGLDQGRAHFVPAPDGPINAVMRSPAMFAALSMMRAGDAAIFGTAISLIGWHGAHRFCARCGHGTAVFRGGWGRKCGTCGTEHFPRTDPVVIMVAEHDGRALLGRNAGWPEGRYSALAGFLEPGESIEEAVRREILEETSVPTGAVRYIASQPWPFGGSQLMIGCVAEALDDAITLDPKELSDALWATKDEVRAALAGEPGRFVAPPPFAIAHTLLRVWAA